jgi:hypothetical protein
MKVRLARSSPTWRDDLALRPGDSETFLKEVDEELRREQTLRFFKRYGWWIGALFVAFLAAIAGWMWWQEHRQAEIGAQGEELTAALDSLEAGNRNAAAPKLAELSNSPIVGYRVAALFARANSEIAANHIPAAVATLRGIAADQEFDEVYRQAALIRQTQLEFDGLPPQQVVQRMRPLAAANSPWLGTAGELLGVAYLKLHRPDLAGPVFAAIGRNHNLPDSLRTRAIQMAGSLGINAADEPAAANGATPATTSAAAAAAAPGPQGNSQ